MSQTVTLVETASGLLKQTLKKVPTVYADEAKALAAQIQEQAQMVSRAAEAARGEVSYNLRARLAVSEADRQVREADYAVKQLDGQGRYGGPQRSKMTVAEKARFIRDHSEEEFLLLPE
jgi:hypothetical protein